MLNNYVFKLIYTSEAEMLKKLLVLLLAVQVGTTVGSDAKNPTDGGGKPAARKGLFKRKPPTVTAQEAPVSGQAEAGKKQEVAVEPAGAGKKIGSKELDNLKVRVNSIATLEESIILIGEIEADIQITPPKKGLQRDIPGGLQELLEIAQAKRLDFLVKKDPKTLDGARALVEEIKSFMPASGSKGTPKKSRFAPVLKYAEGEVERLERSAAATGAITAAAEAAKLKVEQERVAKEEAEARRRAEAERVAQEKAAAQQRAEEERAAQEKAAAQQRVEAERVAKEEAEAWQRVEAERVAKEEAEARQRAEAERVAKEKAAAQQRAEQERIVKEGAAAQQRAEQERIAKEEAVAQQRAEQERIAKEEAVARQRAEQERIAKEEAVAQQRAEQERIVKEGAAAQQRAEQERIAKEEAVARQRAEQERIVKEGAAAQQRAEQERIAKEEAVARQRAEEEEEISDDEQPILPQPEIQGKPEEPAAVERKVANAGDGDSYGNENEIAGFSEEGESSQKDEQLEAAEKKEKLKKLAIEAAKLVKHNEEEAEEKTRQGAELLAKFVEEAKRQQEEQARLAQEEAKRQQEEQARLVQEEAKRQQEEQARLAQEEAKRQQEEQARLAQEEAKRQQEEQARRVQEATRDAEALRSIFEAKEETGVQATSGSTEPVSDLNRELDASEKFVGEEARAGRVKAELVQKEPASYDLDAALKELGIEVGDAAEQVAKPNEAEEKDESSKQLVDDLDETTKVLEPKTGQPEVAAQPEAKVDVADSEEAERVKAEQERVATEEAAAQQIAEEEASEEASDSANPELAKIETQGELGAAADGGSSGNEDEEAEFTEEESSQADEQLGAAGAPEEKDAAQIATDAGLALQIASEDQEEGQKELFAQAAKQTQAEQAIKSAIDAFLDLPWKGTRAAVLEALANHLADAGINISHLWQARERAVQDSPEKMRRLHLLRPIFENYGLLKIANPIESEEQPKPNNQEDLEARQREHNAEAVRKADDEARQRAEAAQKATAQEASVKRLQAEQEAARVAASKAAQAQKEAERIAAEKAAQAQQAQGAGENPKVGAAKKGQPGNPEASYLSQLMTVKGVSGVLVLAAAAYAGVKYGLPWVQAKRKALQAKPVK